jgi:hypothetical protein
MPTVPATKVQPGDLAWHKTRTLDPRPVAEVDHKARTIRLQIGTLVTDPIPRANYTYTRDPEAE